MAHGGKRPNSGRPKGSGAYAEPTKPLRIPLSLVSKVQKYIANKGHIIPNDFQTETKLTRERTIEFIDEDSRRELSVQQSLHLKGKGYCYIPLFSSKIQAGFPSPADDYKEGLLSLDEHLIKHPASTFFVRAIGQSMINAGIFPNDILVVDKSLTASEGKIIVAIIDGEFTVKRLKKEKNKIVLMPENPEFKPIEICEGQDFQIWGVVTNVIHSL